MGVIRLDKTTRKVLVKESSEPPFTFGNVYKTFGGTDYAQVSGLSGLNNATKATLVCWIKVEAGKIAVFGGNISGTNRFAINPYSDNIVYFNCANGSNTRGQADFTPYLGVWTMVALVFDNSAGATNSDKLKAYVNDAVPLSLTYMGTIPSSLSNNIGSAIQINKGGVFNFFGTSMYANSVITTDAATPSQISAFWNGGNGAWAEDCFTNIISNLDMNQPDGSASIPDRIGSGSAILYNSSTPPPYFVPF